MPLMSLVLKALLCWLVRRATIPWLPLRPGAPLLHSQGPGDLRVAGGLVPENAMLQRTRGPSDMGYLCSGLGPSRCSALGLWFSYCKGATNKYLGGRVSGWRKRWKDRLPKDCKWCQSLLLAGTLSPTPSRHWAGLSGAVWVCFGRSWSPMWWLSLWRHQAWGWVLEHPCFSCLVPLGPQGSGCSPEWGGVPWPPSGALGT